MSMAIASESVVLKGGFVVSIDALRLLWALEERGLNVKRDGEGLVVGPRGLLTDEDTNMAEQIQGTVVAGE